MGRRRFDRSFKLEAVKLVRDRGVSASQAARDCQGQMKPEQLEIERLRREVVRLKAERDILKNCHGPLPACERYKQPVLSLRLGG